MIQLKRNKVTSRLVLTVILKCIVLIPCVSFAQDKILDSPFGFHPAAAVPPFEYGLDNPYTFAVDLGVKWERPLNFIWTRIQPDLTTDTYYWMNERQMLNTPTQMCKMANIIIGNPRHDPKYGQYALNNRSFLPKDEKAYKKFVMALVERYDGDTISDMPNLSVPIKHWQIENEPPHGLHDYAAFLKITYEAVKEADPDAKVIIGGVPGFPPASQYINNFDKHYLPILDDLSRLKKSYFDIFDFHWYGNATGDYLGIRDAYQHIKNALEERKLIPSHGFWMTEMGTYSGDPAPTRMLSSVDFPFQTEKQQAIDVIKRNVYALSLGVKKIFMAFGVTEGFRNAGGYFDFTGFVYDGKHSFDQGKGVKKLSYYSYKKMTETMEGSDWESIQTIQEKDDLHIYKLNKNGKSIWIAWNDSSTSTPITLRLNKKTTDVNITESVPDCASGKDVLHYDSVFQSIQGTILKSIPPQLNFSVGEVPVFIEEK